MTSPHDSPLRRLERTPNPDPNHWSTRRINAVHAAFPHMRTYLEIGIDTGHTLENVTLPIRIGVDPHPGFDTTDLPENMTVHSITSDVFFASTSTAEDFDVAFVDGLHTYQQTYHDIVNVLRRSPHALVLVDDVVPTDRISAIPDQSASLAERRRLGISNIDWHGDVFKVILILSDHHRDLEWITITDRGNPQTFLWCPRPLRAGRLSRIRPISKTLLDSYRGITYDEVFASGVPETFHPARENDTLQRVIEAMTPSPTPRRRSWSLRRRT